MNFNKTNRNACIALLATLAISSHYFCTSQPAENAPSKTTTEKKELTKTELIAKGKYLVTVGGCNDCHSPKVMTAMGPEPDTTRLLSGHQEGSPLPPITYDGTKPGNWMLFSPSLTAFVGPWGISYAANLTPDSTTGIGAWDADVFKKTLRTGKHLGLDGGRPILPPMPWQLMAQMTDEDLTLIFTYLESIPAIKNQVPQPVPPTEVMKTK